ncbi:hypothetical protein CRG98_034584 [Punica granatum]|uniref:Uncharacterized protein n=1 Tax=Punica granatum TaxID=22663 RepID=A0A2I0ILX5_PUNGR|nr:hypothetical protein CRG98_034584 [Punica granatum]
MHVGKHEETRESNLDRAKRAILDPKEGARVQWDARSGKERHAARSALACTGVGGCSDARSGAQKHGQARGRAREDRRVGRHGHARRMRACMHAARCRGAQAQARAVTSKRRRGEHAHGRARAGDAERLGVRRVHCSPESTSINGDGVDGLSVVFNLLGYFGLSECKRARGRGQKDRGKGRLPLGSPWVPWLKRRNREKARVSIGRAFVVRGLN